MASGSSGISFFAIKLSRLNEAMLQSYLCDICPERASSLLTRFAKARASKNTHFCVRYLSEAQRAHKCPLDEFPGATSASNMVTLHPGWNYCSH